MRKRIAQIAITALSLLVMVEALFWPIVFKPGTPLEWWQNFYLAKIGQYVGLPAWVVLLKSPFEGTLQLVFSWILVITWASFIFWLTGAIIDFVKNLKK